jgi:hypothetical protein
VLLTLNRARHRLVRQQSLLSSAWPASLPAAAAPSASPPTPPPPEVRTYRASSTCASKHAASPEPFSTTRRQLGLALLCKNRNTGSLSGAVSRQSGRTWPCKPSPPRENRQSGAAACIQAKCTWVADNITPSGGPRAGGPRHAGSG